MQEKPGLLYDQLSSVVSGMGYTLVEAQGAKVKGILKVSIIVFSENGIATKDCVDISRTLNPRLEVLYDTKDVSLEVSSPGLERKFSSFSEFKIFLGKYVKIYIEGKDWLYGIIKSVQENTVEITTKDRLETISSNEIVKAQLVYQEVR